MNSKAFAFGFLSTVLIGTSMVATAQREKTQPLRPTQPPVVRYGDGTSKIQKMIGMNLGNGITATAFLAEPNQTYLSYATALFNPKEYKLDRVAAIVWPSSDGKGGEPFALTDFVAMPLRMPEGQSERINKSVQWEPHKLFLESDSPAMVQLPPAISVGMVDPIGHIWCLQKTRTKSNNANDRLNFMTESPIVEAVNANQIQISLDNGSGKGPITLVPLEMGSMKLTKADAGRTLDAVATKKKTRDWIQNSYDKRGRFDPTLVNVLQFDIATADVARLSSQFQAGQGLRVKVRFPWLCDVDCSMTEPLDTAWIEKISSQKSRVNIRMVVINSAINAPH